MLQVLLYSKNNFQVYMFSLNHSSSLGPNLASRSKQTSL